MNEDQYKTKMEMAERSYKIQITGINETYAKTNSSVKIDDIVEDHKSKIKVDKIDWGFSLGCNFPESIYYGRNLTKVGKPFKNGDRDGVYQSNLKNINGVPVKK